MMLDDPPDHLRAARVEADDPARNRCGCFLPDLTRLATAPSADFRAGIWVKRAGFASSTRKFMVADRALHELFTRPK
jgi:hypothetical protein